MQSHRLGYATERSPHPKLTHRRHRQRVAARNERVLLIASNADDALDQTVIRFQIVIGDWPVDQGRRRRKRGTPPLLPDVTQWLEMVGMKAAQPGSVVEDRAADAVDHAPERVGCFTGRLV